MMSVLVSSRVKSLMSPDHRTASGVPVVASKKVRENIILIYAEFTQCPRSILQLMSAQESVRSGELGSRAPDVYPYNACKMREHHTPTSADSKSPKSFARRLCHIVTVVTGLSPRAHSTFSPGPISKTSLTTGRDSSRLESSDLTAYIGR